MEKLLGCEAFLKPPTPKCVTKQGSRPGAEIRLKLLPFRPDGFKMVAFNVRGERGSENRGK